MSESAGKPREWRLYIEDMIGFCEKVLNYTAGLDRNTFFAGGMPYDATLRNLELIGEAATRIPETARNAHAEIPWRTVVGTRNRLIHGYLGIDNDIAWDIIQNDVPALLLALRNLLNAVDRK